MALYYSKADYLNVLRVGGIWSSFRVQFELRMSSSILEMWRRMECLKSRERLNREIYDDKKTSSLWDKFDFRCRERLY